MIKKLMSLLVCSLLFNSNAAVAFKPPVNYFNKLKGRSFALFRQSAIIKMECLIKMIKNEVQNDCQKL